jgi:hypothetical protein
MNEIDIMPRDIEREHLAEVHPLREWVYLVGVPALGLVLMLALMAVFDALG